MEYTINICQSQEIYENNSRLSLLQDAAKALIFSLPVAYFVQGIVLFDILPIYLNVFLFLGFSAYLFGSAQDKQVKKVQ